MAGERAGFMPIVLLDVEVLDGTQFFWSDHAGTFPSRLTGSDETYQPWIQSVGTLVRSKTIRTNAMDIAIQNISGNAIDRDLFSAFIAHEFEGALAVLRFYEMLSGTVKDEQHGYLTEPSLDPTQGAWRLLQLFDASLIDVPGDIYLDSCTWRFKSPMCGSSGSATDCPKTLAACQDASRAAQERFNAITIVPAGSIGSAPVGSPGVGPPGGGPGSGKGHGLDLD